MIVLDTHTLVWWANGEGEFHEDAADRLIVATARRHVVPVVTADAKIRDYPHVRSIW